MLDLSGHAFMLLRRSGRGEELREKESPNPRGLRSGNIRNHRELCGSIRNRDPHPDFLSKVSNKAQNLSRTAGTSRGGGWNARLERDRGSELQPGRVRRLL